MHHTTADRPLEDFFAVEGPDPLQHAFSGKQAVHPSVGFTPIAPDAVPAVWTQMTSTPRTGHSVAYLHIPFCENHCLFCGFYQNAWNHDDASAYVDALIAHLRHDRMRDYQAEHPLQAVYFGGGTPTLLATADLVRAIQAVREYLPLAADCEITVEGRVQDLDPAKCAAIFAAGANRLSLGVQTFDETLRRRLGRHSGRNDLLRRLEAVIAADQGTIVIDLIYGLPGQSLEHWESDVRTAIGLGLDGIDLYSLKVIGQTPLAGALERGRFDATPLEQLGLYYARGAELMEQARWATLSTSHWRGTTRERNLYNLTAKEGTDCLAFGAGAGGALAGYSYRTLSTLAEHAERLHNDQPPIAGIVRQSRHRRLFSFIKGSLERGTLDYQDLRRRLTTCGATTLADSTDQLFDQWGSAGLLRRGERWIDLTLAGRFWQVRLTLNLLQWLNQGLRGLDDPGTGEQSPPTMAGSKRDLAHTNRNTKHA